MTTRITKLTDTERDAMAAHAQKWIDIGRRTGEADWGTFETGARTCYGYADIPWHNNVVRVSSPLVLALAAPIAAHLIEQAGPRQRRGAVGDAVDGAVRGAVDGAVRGAVGGAVHDAVRGAVHDAVGGAVRGAVGDAVHDAVRDAVGDAMGGAVRGAVGGAVSGAVSGAVRGAVDDAVRGAVGDAVDDAVRGAVGDAVDGAVDDAVLRQAIRRCWYYRLGGQWWVNWSAWTSYFRDVCNLELPGDLWERDRAYAQAQSSAGWWWPHRQFLMVCDRPRELHLEQVAPTGWGSHRLHCETGPAVRWADGYALHFWHGTLVPADLVEGDGWAPDRILTERNAEIRRCAIERRGWDRFVVDAGLAQVGATVPDPGNPGRELALYDVPAAIYDEPIRVLLCSNGSHDRDGKLRRFGLTVPGDIPDPVAAAGWTYDVSPAEYAGLARRT